MAYERIKEDLRNRIEFNEGVKHLVEVQHGISGSFYTKLFDAMMSADYHNLQRFRASFPEETEAVYRFKNESDYWDKAEKAYQDYIDSNR